MRLQLTRKRHAQLSLDVGLQIATRRNQIIKRILLAALLAVSFATLAKDLYRAPTAGDSGKYYVLNIEKLDSGEFKVLTSRVGKGGAYTDFTELKINCQTQQYYELAGGEEDGVKEMPTKPLADWSSRSKWTSLVPGSSKSDLVNYVCNKQR
jgi:hypothetical protein